MSKDSREAGPVPCDDEAHCESEERRSAAHTEGKSRVGCEHRGVGGNGPATGVRLKPETATQKQRANKIGCRQAIQSTGLRLTPATPLRQAQESRGSRQQDHRARFRSARVAWDQKLLHI
jgi:hypothetical protein